MSVADVYRLLFGRKGIQDGNVIDMSEHGRVGGLSNGQGFKFVDQVQYKTILDDRGDTVYIGVAKHGTNKSESYWRIKKIVTNDGVTETLCPNGSDEFNFVWDNRENYTYL